MTQTVIGGSTGYVRTPEQLAADAEALQRRTSIQTYFNANEGEPLKIMEAMAMFGVDAAELSHCMDYRLNITHYLRRNGAPDGFGGLKVWPAATIQRFFDYVKSVGTNTGIGLPGIDDPVIAQDVLDNTARIEAAFPSYKAPWNL